ncbi:hypothetical protein RB200_09015 [Streptomyces sp. PmtG]
MHITARRSVRTSAISTIAALTASAIFATMAPAHAAGGSAKDAAEKAMEAAARAEAAVSTAAAVHKAMDAAKAARLAAPRAGANGSLTAEAAGTRVDLPATSAGKMTVTDPTGARIKIGLPGSDAAKAHASSEGTVVYPQLKGGAADVAAQVTTDGSASALITLRNASAPTEYRFPLELPKDAVPVINEDGSLVIIDGTTETRADGEGDIIGAFEAPWAKDAKGKEIPTTYEVDGTELVQKIQTDASTAYPVVADPKWWDKTKSWAKKAGKTAWKYGKKYGVRCAKGAWHGAKNPGAMTPQQKAAFAALGCAFFAIKK